MVKLPPESPMFPGRGISIRGRFYSKWVNGQLVVARWPRSQPGARTAKEADNRKLLAVASRVSLSMSPQETDFARRLAAESKLLPRDFLMIALFKRIGTVVMRDGRKVFSMAAVQDVSSLLDALGQIPGDMLARGETFWERLPIGAHGQILAVSAEGMPEWIDAPSGGAGSDAWMQPLLLNPTAAGLTTGAGAFTAIPVVPSSNVTLNGLRVWCRATGTGRQVVPGIYQSNGMTLQGGARVGAGPAVNAALGVMTLPFSAPVALLANTLYWLGLTVINGSGNFQTMQSDVNRNSYMYFTQTNAALPATAPSSTAGLGGLQFTWWGY